MSMPSSQPKNKAPSKLKYHGFYCEENIWQLCQEPEFKDGYAVFIASEGECFPMFNQASGEGKHHLIYWDYHVVMLHQGMIYDFDSTLGFATPLTTYLLYSMPDETQMDPAMIARFRVIDATQFVSFFESDRRHMRVDNQWTAAPPEWPQISENTSNLAQFTNVHDREFGEVLTANDLMQRFATTPSLG